MHEGSCNHGHVEELVAVERQVKAAREKTLRHARSVEARTGLDVRKSHLILTWSESPILLTETTYTAFEVAWLTHFKSIPTDLGTIHNESKSSTAANPPP